jgi:hypothetical protein
MAAVDTKSDVEILDALDFDHKEGCDKKTCPMAATFVVMCRTCGFAFLLCTLHFLRLKAACNAATVIVCVECKAHGHSFEQFCRVIPVGAR